MDVLADTGILLRLLEPTDPFHASVEQAVKVLLTHWFGQPNPPGWTPEEF
jgi:hypothetical protein